MTRLAAIALVLAGVLTGCGSGGGADKAGATSHERVVLRFANTAFNPVDSRGVQGFVRRVRAISHGALRIEIVNQWGDYMPDAEGRVVHDVAAGKADLGSVGSRVFDTLGVKSFRVLSAPMLIDSDALQSAVTRSAIPGRMLPALDRLGVKGLALVGDGVRLPIGVRRPLVRPADWRGLRFGVYRSAVEGQAVRALGATPVVAFGPVRNHALDSGALGGFDFDLRRYSAYGYARTARYVVTNVVLWPNYDVLLANPSRFASLSARERGWVEQAARETARASARFASATPATARRACAMGARLETASDKDLSALRRSFAPVYSSLESDAQTREFIAAIQRLKRSVAAPSGLAVRC